MWYIWLGVVFATLLVEFLSKNFVAICFSISAILSAIITIFTGNYVIQVSVFLIVGILLIAIVRPNVMEYLKKFKKNKKKKAKK